MIIKSKFKNVVSIFLLVLTIFSSSTSVFASDINTIINVRSEDTHIVGETNNKSTTQMYKWKKYNVTYHPVVSGECIPCYGNGIDHYDHRDFCEVCGSKNGKSYFPVQNRQYWRCFDCSKDGQRMLIPVYCTLCNGSGEVQSSPAYYSRGAYLTTVTGTQNTYPNNGQSGSYWYVYEGIATQPQAPLTITGVPDEIAYGDTFNLNANGGSPANPIEWSVTSGNATINQQGEVIATGIGAVTIKALKKGTPNVYYDVEKSVTFDVNPKLITATGTITANPKEYDGELTGTVTHDLVLHGIINNDEVKINPIVTNFTGKDVGGNIDVTLESLTLTNDKYTLEQPTLTGYKSEISVKILTIDLDVADKIYDGTTTAEYKGTPTLVGVVEGETVSLTNGKISFADKSAGDEKQVVYSDFSIDNSNYILTQPSNTTAKITPLDIEISDYEVDDKIYDGTAKATVKTMPKLSENTIFNDDIVGIESYISNFSNKNIGESKIVKTAFVLGGKDKGNYNIKNVADVNANITPKNIGITNIKDKYYDTTLLAEFETTPKLSGTINNDDIDLIVGTPTFGNENAEINKNIVIKDFEITGSDVGNYSLAQPKLTGEILPKIIDIIVDRADKIINEKDPVFTFSNDKLYNDDELVGNISRVKGEVVGEYNYIVGTLYAGDNYSFKVSADEIFEIKKGETKLNLTLQKSYDVPTKITINAIVADETDGRIDFYLNGKRMTSRNVVNNQAEFVFSPLKAGYYSVNAVLVDSSSYHNAVSNIVDFTVTNEELGLDNDKECDCGDKDCDGSCEDKDNDCDCGNINRQVSENNKLLNATMARISRLMQWQREDKLKPLDLTQTGEKVSVKAQLQEFSPQMQASQYQKIKNLKDHASILSFLERNGIDDLEDFHNEIGAINKSFYVIKGEITKTEQEIYSFDKKVELWEEYEKLKPTLKKYNVLSDSDKKTVYKKHFVKIDRAKELKKIWKDYIDSGNEITPKVWKRESAKLKNNKKLYNWKMEQLKDELGRAEKITKRLDKMQIVDEIAKSKTREMEI